MINLPDLFRSERSLFDDAFRDLDDMMNRMMVWPMALNRSAALQGPRTSVDEVENGYLLSVEVPGFTKEDVKVDVRENQIFISGEIHREEGQGPSEYSRRVSRFQRSFSLPYEIDPAKVQASCDNGLLEVFIPAGAEAGTSSIAIGSGAPLWTRLKGAAAKEVSGRTQQKAQAKGTKETEAARH